jgi:hypothetical protein
MKPVNLELRIEELVLRGFAPSERHRIGETLERELARLFAERGTPPSLDGDGAIRHLDGGAFEVSSGAGAETIGLQVARAVHGGLST